MSDRDRIKHFLNLAIDDNHKAMVTEMLMIADRIAASLEKLADIGQRMMTMSDSCWRMLQRTPPFNRLKPDRF